MEIILLRFSLITINRCINPKKKKKKCVWWIYVNSKSWHQDISSGVSEFLPILGNFNINVNFKKIVELASKWIYEETFSQLTCWVCDRGTTPTIHYNPRISSKWEKHQKLIPIFLNIAKNKKLKKKSIFISINIFMISVICIMICSIS